MEVLDTNDVVWIHDYHLMLLPSLLKAHRPQLSIGFFLHIPFPSFEIFRLLPNEWRREILEGLLGADLIGFHTMNTPNISCNVSFVFWGMGTHWARYWIGHAL